MDAGVIAREPGWSAIHLPSMFFAVALLVAMVTLADRLDGPGFGTWLLRSAPRTHP